MKPLSDTKSQTIRYRLYRIGIGTSASHDYQIYVRYLNDSACAVFQAPTPQAARQIYRAVVKGTVTPCTLADVVNDVTGR